MKIKLALLTLATLLLAGCIVEEPEEATTPGLDGYTMVTDEKIIKESQKTVEGFYSWYFDDVYGKQNLIPDHIDKDDSIYLLDLRHYLSILHKVPQISPKFIETDSIMVQECNKNLRKQAWVTMPDGSFDVEGCDFLWYYKWVGGQGEDFTGYKFKDVLQKESSFIARGNIMAYDLESTPLLVYLSHYNNELKIDEIVLNY